ncbi:uncharacterized protein LOC129575432 [Sitodiplosis mosellana]|uniref:uncharacterized protein LOC129575432 n=1 Tax=Sitodiplosis mosellana TaxID=263140 RepID=UPI002443A888|nr:uncharacterized protein LOC129575432 [Sitodiplosis mosellana]
MSSLKQRYERFADFMQHNTKGVEIGIYSISGALFAVSYYKIRPITKFTRSKDIPKHFITKKISQKGKIKAIEPNQQAGALLRIDHKPPLNLFHFSQKTLPVKIFGVDINGNGYSWLQSVTLNHKVKFLPISKGNANFAECQVSLLQDPALNAKPSIDLAESLISLGFAKTNSQLGISSADAQLKSYLKKLQAAQAKACNRGLPWPINLLTSNISRLIYKKLFPPKYRLPELVR